MRQVPRVDELGRIQGIDGTSLGTFVLDARVPAADALQAIRGIEADDICKGTPFEHASVDLPLVAVGRPTQEPIRATSPLQSSGRNTYDGRAVRGLAEFSFVEQLARGLFQDLAIVLQERSLLERL